MRSVLDLEFPSERECFLGFHDSQCVVLDVSSQTLGIFIFFLVSPIQGKKKTLRGKRVCGSRGHKSVALKALATRPESS